MVRCFCTFAIFCTTQRKINISISCKNFLVCKFCEKVVSHRVSGEIGECAFPQNFHSKKLGEITVFYAVTKNEMSPHLPNFIMVINHRTSIKCFEKSNILVSQTLK